MTFGNNLFFLRISSSLHCHGIYSIGVIGLAVKFICKKKNVHSRTNVIEELESFRSGNKFDIYFYNDIKLLVIYASCIAMKSKTFVNKFCLVFI